MFEIGRVLFRVRPFSNTSHKLYYTHRRSVRTPFTGDEIKIISLSRQKNVKFLTYGRVTVCGVYESEGVAIECRVNNVQARDIVIFDLPIKIALQ